MSENITTRIRSVLAESEAADPAVVAEEVLAGASAAERKAWLSQILPRFVADVMRSERNTALNHSARPGRRMPSASAKVAGVRDWWTKFLEARISVGEDWKSVGDLTAEDLSTVVAERRDQAARIHTQADRYEALAELLARHKVSRVRELPSDVVLASGVAVAA
ncbi:hypothetical protein SEA_BENTHERDUNTHAT_58 [Gordonia phage BENtherdunthat]|uniref:Uncharacterized protein n=1 Tax=Gordonia phage BENtherdunthat TaxID=2047830 RepID=A0A2H4PF70_9CAUD|nr:hypothetical protein HOS44_gp058 [Gordonia phage BENtherdunthat]ATW60828.1 hypothetical protein SEA_BENTHERDUNTHAT_58 [Gordonia phage BENtherdunthat]